MRNLSSTIYTPIGYSFYFPPKDNNYPLGGGREIWFGFHQLVQPSQWTMTLTLDGNSYLIEAI